jgi:hypothetical protein
MEVPMFLIDRDCLKRLLFFCAPLILIACGQMVKPPGPQYEVKILEVKGATSFSNGQILGGFAGPKCTSKDNLESCNNCKGSIKACNERRSYEELVLRVHFESEEVTGWPLAFFDEKPIMKQDEKVSPGEWVALEVPWSRLCKVSDNYYPDGCDNFGETLPLKLEVGVDSNNDGDLDDADDAASILDVRLLGASYPFYRPKCSDELRGQEKCGFSINYDSDFIVLEETYPNVVSSLSTDISEYIVVGARLYYSMESFDQISLESPYFSAPFYYNGWYPQADEGLTWPIECPGEYFFNLALEDIAGNVYNFTPEVNRTRKHKIRCE